MTHQPHDHTTHFHWPPEYESRAWGKSFCSLCFEPTTDWGMVGTNSSGSEVRGQTAQRQQNQTRLPTAALNTMWGPTGWGLHTHLWMGWSGSEGWPGHFLGNWGGWGKNCPGFSFQFCHIPAVALWDRLEEQHIALSSLRTSEIPRLLTVKWQNDNLCAKLLWGNVS